MCTTGRREIYTTMLENVVICLLVVGCWQVMFACKVVTIFSLNSIHAILPLSALPQTWSNFETNLLNSVSTTKLCSLLRSSIMIIDWVMTQTWSNFEKIFWVPWPNVLPTIILCLFPKHDSDWLSDWALSQTWSNFEVFLLSSTPKCDTINLCLFLKHGSHWLIHFITFDTFIRLQHSNVNKTKSIYTLLPHFLR